MSTMSIEIAQAHLTELIEQLHPGEEIIITRAQLPVARLIRAGEATPTRCRYLGTMKGTIRYVAPDFDAPLDDFKEYAE